MRYYLIDNDQNEVILDITEMNKTLEGLTIASVTLNEEKKDIYFRELAGKVFYSFDKKTWKKTFKTIEACNYFNGKDYFKVFAGFKPSGLFSSNAGNLVTQMPGKIVQILVKPNDIVKKGDTLLILEAMKMENEIKASMDGTIKNIHVEAGKAVETGFLMMEIE